MSRMVHVLDTSKQNRELRRRTVVADEEISDNFVILLNHCTVSCVVKPLPDLTIPLYTITPRHIELLCVPLQHDENVLTELNGPTEKIEHM